MIWLKPHNLNTVVFQIRPAADAFYHSSLEPWSQWLTGKQGKAPEPFYDPLDFTIKECRKRGLDIHVWLNPYRAVRDTANRNITPEHITKTHPELFLTYGTTKYFDPGLPQTRDHVARVVSDIVRRYDIDAIHMDDYFYPYRIAGVSFPDDSSFVAFRGDYADNQRDDWRRNNVDKIIKQLYDSIKTIKPWVEFGISPFGVWRNADRDPAGSATRAGQTNYDDLFADILKWQREKWIDYVVPQLYWHIGMTVADYAVLADWWNRNAQGCPLYIGQAFYRIDKKSTVKSWRSAKEIVRQVNLNRSLDNIRGSVYFSAKYMRTNPGRLSQNLRKVYTYPALPPENDRITAIIPGLPEYPHFSLRNDSIHFSWSGSDATRNFIVYRFRIGKPAERSDPRNIIAVTPDSEIKIAIKAKTTLKKYYYVITSQSTTNTESGPVYFTRPGNNL